MGKNYQIHPDHGKQLGGPIRKFHLTVLSDNPEDIVLTCMPGLKRTADTRYEVSHSDWHPTAEIELMILQTNRPEDR